MFHISCPFSLTQVNPKKKSIQMQGLCNILLTCCFSVVRSCQPLPNPLAARQPLSASRCLLISSQLPSMSGGFLLHAVVTSNSFNMICLSTMKLFCQKLMIKLPLIVYLSAESSAKGIHGMLITNLMSRCLFSVQVALDGDCSFLIDRELAFSI